MFDDMDITELLPKGFYIEDQAVGSLDSLMILYTISLFRKRLFRKPELVHSITADYYPTIQGQRDLKLELLDYALSVA